MADTARVVITDEPRTRRSAKPAKASLSARMRSGFLGTFCATCLIGLVGLAALVAFTIVPTFFGWRPDVILTGSMAPAIQAGDVVISSPAAPHQVAPGRVVIMKDPSHPGALLMHRVVRINPDGTITSRGDANEDADAIPVKLVDVLAIPRIRVPMIGLPVIWQREGKYLPLAAASTVLLVMLWGASGVRRRPVKSASKSRGKRARGSQPSPPRGQAASTTASSQ